MDNKNMNSRVSFILKLRYKIQGHLKSINRMAWSLDGTILATPSNDTTIRLWDTQTGQHLKTLIGHANIVPSIAWSPDGTMLVSGSADSTIRLWDVQTGQSQLILTGHADAVLSVAWSPDGTMLASSSEDKTIRLWDVHTGKHLKTLIGHNYMVLSVAWSPDGTMLASSSEDKAIRLWDVQTGQSQLILTGHADAVLSIAWSPDGTILASGSVDSTIRLWDVSTGRPTNIFEGHTGSVQSVSFSSDGHFLASKASDGTVRIWQVRLSEAIMILEEAVSGDFFSGAVFHPVALNLATLDEYDTVIRLWDIVVFSTPSETDQITASVHYANAKVVLVGDSGVGKTGLGLVLTGHPYVSTDSTHDRYIWKFDSHNIELDFGHIGLREVLLWDLAGQPGYRLIHQLHLSEVSVALVVFDSRNETDPFSGVGYWARALQLSERIQGNSAPHMKKFLVAARIDRGGKSVSRERIDKYVQELGFDGYFETSAKEGLNINELIEAIKSSIDWEMLPKVTSSDLFQRIKTFLVIEKEEGRLLSTYDDLYRAFIKTGRASNDAEDLNEQFGTCIGRMESQGLIRRLSFGNLVLLQPELLDIYASALVNTVKDEPDGLGSISEQKVLAGNFFIPKDQRLKEKEEEKLLLIAMVEDLLRYEIALREQGDDGPYLVFPSQSTRENPDLPDPEGKEVIFSFEGPVQNIYTTLCVRLSHSGLFSKRQLWKNAIIYTSKVGGVYGLCLNNHGEGYAELILFFDKSAKEETRIHFEEFVQAHLLRRAISESLKRRRIFTCSNCGFLVTDQLIQIRNERGFNWLNCPGCEKRISLLDHEDRLPLTPSAQVLQMDRTADSQRERDVADSILQGNSQFNIFDVFLCYNSRDRVKVKEIGVQLKEKGLSPWLDEWELQPGQPWQRILQKQIMRIKSAAVFVGNDGVGPWQNEEIDSLLSEFVNRGCAVIPVLLSNAPKEPELPIFLKNRTWVDFRKRDPDPMGQLIWGITGLRNFVR